MPGPARAYQAAMEAAVSIPLGLALGWLGDRSFGSEPILLVAGLVVGFTAFVRRILRMREDVERAAAAASEGQAPRRAREGNEREERFGIGDFGGGKGDDDD